MYQNKSADTIEQSAFLREVFKATAYTCVISHRNCVIAITIPCDRPRSRRATVTPAS
jgi:hypothetical protein